MTPVFDWWAAGAFVCGMVCGGAIMFAIVSVLLRAAEINSHEARMAHLRREAEELHAEVRRVRSQP